MTHSDGKNPGLDIAHMKSGYVYLVQSRQKKYFQFILGTGAIESLYFVVFKLIRSA